MVVVTGKIRGKARPRVCRGHAFTPKDTVQYEKLVRDCYKQQDGRYLEGPIKALIIAYYKIPKSYSKKRIQAIRDGLEKPTKKPDADNIGKIILDSLNGIAYKDDSQIIELIITKKYTEDFERVEFELI
ncbi:RusA family crossover junction endodeoxyribonuclease [Clostridium perfringens]|nr:RusA family crossover junction endodeoxyribonuclease [Clostridium perfringens]